jgi:Ca-activated chloride channel homolog
MTCPGARALSWRFVTVPSLVACLACTMACGGASEARGTSQSSNTRASNTKAEQYWRELIAARGADFAPCLREVAYRRPSTPAPITGAPMPVRNVLIALDSSGSMAAKTGGERKIDAAKRAATEFLGRLPTDVNVGMIVYGHRGTNRPEGKAASCAGVEVRYPLHPFDRDTIADAITSVEPAGWTPLAAAIDRAGTEMTAFDDPQKQNVVYVVSDGLETCGGNAADAARRLHAANVRTIVNIVGFALGNAEQRELRAVAAAGGGQYFNATSGDDLRRILEQSHEQTRKSIYGAANSAADAVNAATTRAAEAVSGSCFDARMAVEESAVAARLATDSSGLSPKIDAGTDTYVKERLRERHTRVRAWRDALLQRLQSGYEASAADLAADLARVMQNPSSERR